jgi:hypothetical protein
MNKMGGHLVGMRGLFLVQFLENGKVVRDLGWRENQITNLGILDFLVNALMPTTTGKKIGWMSLGTGGEPVAGDMVLENEVSTRSAVTGAAVGSNIAEFTASFPSSASLSGHPITITNVGLFDSSVVATSVMFSGGLIDPLQNRVWVLNQTVKVTYDVEFTSV